MTISIPVKPWLKKYLEAKEYYDGSVIRYRRTHSSIQFIWSLFRRPNPGEVNQGAGDCVITFQVPDFLLRESRIYLDQRSIDMIHGWARREMTREFLHECLILRERGITIKDSINRILINRYGMTEEELSYETIRKQVNRYMDRLDKV